MRGNLLVVAALGTLAVAALTFIAYSAADRFVLADGQLQIQAEALVPERSTVTARVSEQCTESGWTGLFTIKDTCYRIIWNHPGTGKESLREGVVERATGEGWVLAQNPGLAVLLEKPGYRAVVLVVADEEIAKCREMARAPISPEFCGNIIEVQAQ